ncbi:MAG: AAA family ATPase, partial [Alphaproteobacteria bacterium]
MLLKLSLLGGFQAELADGGGVSLPTRKAEALLAYLSIPVGRAHGRDKLTALLWADRGEKQARHSLSQTLFSIRQAIPEAAESILITAGETVALDPGAVEIDVAKLERFVADGSPEGLQRAAALYQGDLLEGVRVRGKAFEDWLELERARLRGLIVEALEGLLVHQTEIGAVQRGIETAVRLLAIDPLQETVHRALMELYVQAGRLGSALKQYDVCAGALRDELGVEPEPETRDLYREISRQRSTRRQEAPPSSLREPTPAPDLIGAERKHVTVICADIGTSRLGAHGQGHGHDLPEPLLRAVRDAAQRYGGTAHRLREGGAVALFGTPVAHEDHAIRACLSALAMRDAVNRLDAENGIRIGVHSGEAIVEAVGDDPPSTMAMGPTLEMAQHLVQVARPGTIYLTVQTHRLVEGFVDVRPAGTSDLDGAGRPIELFELVAGTSARTRWEVRAARGLTTFIGREAELDSLAAPLERAGGGQGQVAAVVGEPGIGKSRLVHELVRSDRTRGFTVLATGAAEYTRHSPYLPVSRLLKGWFEVEERHGSEETGHKIRDRIHALGAELLPLAPAVSALLDLPVADPDWTRYTPLERRARTMDAIKALLSASAKMRPLVLVFEDLHWIDAESQAFLDSLVQMLPKTPMLLLVTFRPEYTHDWGGKTYYTQCRVDPLRPEIAEKVLSALLGDEGGLASLKRTLIERTEGNPFFMEESVRSLVDEGALIGRPGGYRLSREVGDVEVPATVQGVLAARIDRLAVEEKQLLQTAAAIGRDVPYSLLRATVGTPDDMLSRCLARLQAAEFLYETKLFPDIEYAFKHVRTQESAYHSLLENKRQEIHRNIAEVLEDRFPQITETQPELLAHHFTEAGLAERAIAYWHRAGR